MLNNNEFISLERRLWKESSPLSGNKLMMESYQELLSTRDELIYLLHKAQKVVQKYSPALLHYSDARDLEYFREWDDFGDTLDNIAYDLGTDVQHSLSSEPFGPNPLDKFPSIRGKNL